MNSESFLENQSLQGFDHISGQTEAQETADCRIINSMVQPCSLCKKFEGEHFNPPQVPSP